LSGTVVQQASTEYEVCLKCHGLQTQATPRMTRQDNMRNVRLELAPTNASFHPVFAAGKDPALRGFEAGHSASDILTCADCHTSDDAALGGVRGPHGSRFEPILGAEYQQGDPSGESAQHYALCYRCHSRTALMASEASGLFTSG
jgi:hypothetical protein